jgi:hypothetical protein
MRYYTPHLTLGSVIYEDKSKVCKECGSVEFTISEPKGPHAAGLYCTHCDHFWGWLSRMKLQEIVTALGSQSHE